MRTRAQLAAAKLTLASLPDDTFLQVVAACGTDAGDVPLFEAVKGLGCVSKGIRQQLYGMQPLVGIRSLAVVQRPAHGPWRVTLLYEGELTKAVIEQARLGRVRSIDTSDTDQSLLVSSVARRMVPDLLGAGCSLVDLDLSHFDLSGTWSATFGEAVVCSTVLRTLLLPAGNRGLRGPLPELRLPALQRLDLSGGLSGGRFSGGLEPLRVCTRLEDLSLGNNKLSGTLEPLRGCRALTKLDLGDNKLTGSLEPLKGCTALRELGLFDNYHLTGGLEPLRGCTGLQCLRLQNNHLTGGLEPLRGFTALTILSLNGNTLTGGLEPLRGCAALLELYLYSNPLRSGTGRGRLADDDKDAFWNLHEQCTDGFRI